MQRTHMSDPIRSTLPGKRLSGTWRTSLTIGACAAATLIATPLAGHLDLANIVMVFLLGVLVVAVTLGRNCAILASILSVLLFDFFFVPPRFSLAVEDIQYLVTFAVMLVTGVVTAELAARLAMRAWESQAREHQAQALYETARQLSGARTIAQVLKIAQSFSRLQLDALCRIDLRDGFVPGLEADDEIAPVPTSDPRLVQIAMRSEESVANPRSVPDGSATLYVPLRGSLNTQGVLAADIFSETADGFNRKSSIFSRLAPIVAVAIERIHYNEVASRSQLAVTEERLRNSILSTLSHDLRTPLTVLGGLAESLLLSKPALSDTTLETACALRDQAHSLTKMVGNLLDMARLATGQVILHREWQSLDEVIGSSINMLRPALAQRPVHVELPKELPLLRFDAVLMERVLFNLLENAAKYSDAGSAIDVSVRLIPGSVEVSVTDQGAGLHSDHPDRLFDMFVRGETESATSGTGLGLAICRSIIDAHGGAIHARNAPPDGAQFTFTLPLDTPPEVDEQA